MVKKVIGIEETSGEFENNPYHNVNFYCASEFKNEKSKGLNASRVKVKYENLINSFGKSLNTAEILSLVGKDVEFFYDEFKNVTFVNVIESDSEKK